MLEHLGEEHWGPRAFLNKPPEPSGQFHLCKTVRSWTRRSRVWAEVTVTALTSVRSLLTWLEEANPAIRWRCARSPVPQSVRDCPAVRSEPQNTPSCLSLRARGSQPGCVCAVSSRLRWTARNSLSSQYLCWKPVGVWCLTRFSEEMRCGRGGAARGQLHWPMLASVWIPARAASVGRAWGTPASRATAAGIPAFHGRRNAVRVSSLL